MYCTKCGNILTEGAKFCTVCGNPVQIYAQPSAAPVINKAGVLGVLVRYGRHFSLMMMVYLLFLPFIGIYRQTYFNNLLTDTLFTYSLKEVFDYAVKILRLEQYVYKDDKVSSVLMVAVTVISIVMYLTALINMILTLRDIIRHKEFEKNKVFKQWNRLRISSVLFFIMTLTLWVSIIFAKEILLAIAKQKGIETRLLSDLVHSSVGMSEIYFFTLIFSAVIVSYVLICRKADIQKHATAADMALLKKADRLTLITAVIACIAAAAGTVFALHMSGAI